MAKVTMEIVPTPAADEAYKVVVTHAGSLLAEYPVPSIAAGEAFIKEGAEELQKLAKRLGYL
ncbi:hypothetical protein ACWGTO_28620 [Mesorhizobium sp. PL10]|jgi:ABC-type nitrate/sulfonate/bicarbonate transport system substrate-binding protein